MAGAGLPAGRERPRETGLNFAVSTARVLVFGWLHIHPDMLQPVPHFSFFCLKL